VWGFRSTIWHDRIGPDFIDLAFTRARAAEPNAKLLYNDYNIEQMGNAKADKVFELVSSMKERGIPIDAVGFQAHYYVEENGSTTYGVPNFQAIRDNMARYASIGIDVHITECDFRIGKPLDDTKAEHQNRFFAEMLQVCIDAPNCSHFTVWGLSDQDSWVPGVFDNYDYAHIFDASLMAKPAYHAMTQVFAKYNTDGTPIDMPPPMGDPTPGSKKKESSGCSLSASTNGTASWLAALLGMLGISALSRRRSTR
jgi:endo-1,4-beta-xylanase